jgi:hypothetical protein
MGARVELNQWACPKDSYFGLTLPIPWFTELDSGD